MNRLLPMLQSLTDRSLMMGLVNLMIVILFFAFWMNSADLLAAQSLSSDAAHDQSSGATTHFIVWFLVGIIIISILIVTLLAWWSNRQDDINNMMTFCIKYLMETRNVTQKIEAAEALGQVKDPGALLILVDIVNNQDADENLHKTARGSLQELSQSYRKYESVIDELLVAEEEKDHQKSIDILLANFENKGQVYVQSAFVIGREFIRLKRYADAREWLQKAKIRNHKTVVYVHQISELIDVCNEMLFSEGDDLFQKGDYYNALEHYALASHDLGYAEKQRFVSHLRLACVYCELKHYTDAYQETLHALHDRHETDTSLKLNKLLKRHVGSTGSALESDEKGAKALGEIDSYVANIMLRLKQKSAISI